MVVWVSGVSDEVFRAIGDLLRVRHELCVMDTETWDLWDLDHQFNRTRRRWCTEFLASTVAKVSNSMLVLVRDNLADVEDEQLFSETLDGLGVPYCRDWLNREATAADAPDILAELAI